jgi:hypothetical protein
VRDLFMNEHSTVAGLTAGLAPPRRWRSMHFPTGIHAWPVSPR